MSPLASTTVFRVSRLGGSPLVFAGLIALVGPASLACQPQSSSTAPAGTASQIDDPQRDAWAQPQKVVAALAIADPTLIVADIGAGSGYFSRWLAKAVPQGKVYAVEVNGDLRRHIDTHRGEWGTPNIEARLAVNEHPLLPPTSVDWVFMSNTYAYLPNRVDYLRAVANALRPAGRLAIVDFRPDARCESLQDCPPAGERIDPTVVISEAANAGFQLERQENFLPHQYLLIFQRPATPAAPIPS